MSAEPRERGGVALRSINLTLAVVAPLAHVLELPNKLALDAPLWLAVQQHLYRGWGLFLGGPAEIGALATALALLVASPRSADAAADARCYFASVSRVAARRRGALRPRGRS